MNLTDEEIRIKVAEACGWVKQPFSGAYWSEHYVKGELPSFYNKKPRVEGEDFFVRRKEELPKYPEDLNACAEFEATLTKQERYHYADHICDMCYDGAPDPNVEQVISATARQRCLAYLKTKGVLP